MTIYYQTDMVYIEDLEGFKQAISENLRTGKVGIHHWMVEEVTKLAKVFGFKYEVLSYEDYMKRTRTN
jgi:hypothetical protein